MGGRYIVSYIQAKPHEKVNIITKQLHTRCFEGESFCAFCSIIPGSENFNLELLV